MQMSQFVLIGKKRKGMMQDLRVRSQFCESTQNDTHEAMLLGIAWLKSGKETYIYTHTPPFFFKFYTLYVSTIEIIFFSLAS